MTKLVLAVVEGGVVKIDGKPIDDALLSGLGEAPSSGVALIDGDKVVYITLGSEDLKNVISKLVHIVDKLVTISTGIDAASNSPGGQTANIAQLTTLKTELQNLGGTLT